jgi:4-hydroxybenzoate polyprenyltransferase
MAAALYRRRAGPKRLEIAWRPADNMAMSTFRGRVRLLRLPLFVTAVADAAAGYTGALLSVGNLAAFDWGLVGVIAGTSTGLYLFGMVENDLVDVSRDRLLGAARPLVTGEAGVGTAVFFLVLTLVLAGACTLYLPGPAILLAIATFAAINFYNMGGKRGPAYVAMIVMGLCRLLNFGIGVAAAVGIPRGRIDWELLLPTGPLWIRHGLVLFFAAAMVTGYSIASRRGYRVSSRPWQAVLVLTLVGGVGLWVCAPMLASLAQVPGDGSVGAGVHVVPPLARVLALLVLVALWPGRLWSAAGPERKPAEYSPFIERTLYWLILLDVAFVLDGLLMQG